MTTDEQLGSSLSRPSEEEVAATATLDLDRSLEAMAGGPSRPAPPLW